jgi:hypothetical protein
MTKKFSIEYIQKCLFDKNLLWTNKENGYQNRKTIMNLQCKKCNYLWHPQFKSVEQNKGCPKCSGKAKYTSNEVKNILNMKKITWLDAEKGYFNNRTKLVFQCQKDDCKHIWTTTFSSIIDEKTNCPKCANRIKYTNKEINQILKQKKIIWVNFKDKYHNNREKMKFQCKNCKYIWNTSFRSIRHNNSGCPYCATSKTEKLCRIYLKNKLKSYFPKISPIWMHKLELDGYNDKLNLAFEYNGIQHYKFIPYFHKTEKDFKNQQDRDNLKRNILKEKGIKLLDIPHIYNYKNENKLYKFIDDQLIKLKII